MALLLIVALHNLSFRRILPSGFPFQCDFRPLKSGREVLPLTVEGYVLFIERSLPGWISCSGVVTASRAKATKYPHGASFVVIYYGNSSQDVHSSQGNINIHSRIYLILARSRPASRGPVLHSCSKADSIKPSRQGKKEMNEIRTSAPGSRTGPAKQRNCLSTCWDLPAPYTPLGSFRYLADGRRQGIESIRTKDGGPALADWLHYFTAGHQ